MQRGNHTSQDHPARMTVMQIGLRYGGVGGTQRVTSELLKYLPAQGVDSYLVVPGPEATDAKLPTNVHSFEPGTVAMQKRLRSARRLMLQLIKQTPPDLLASHFALYALPLVDKLRERPMVAHFHGPWAAEAMEEGGNAVAAFIKALLERRIYRSAARVAMVYRELV